MLPVSLILILFFTAANLYPNLSKAIRVAVFEVVTASTTTGFSTVSYGNWNAFGWVILITLMVIGGGTCSTAGGIKQYRIYLLWKSLWWELRQNFLPRTSVTQNSIWEADHQVFVKDSSLRRVGNFLFLYILTLALGTGILTAHGYGFKESLFEYASALGTVGLSVGITSNSAPSGVLWAEIAGMLLGRLEFLVIFISSIKIIQDAGKFFRAYFFNSGK
jgi:trk system potassium uptake protein TrkH